MPTTSPQTSPTKAASFVNQPRTTDDSVRLESTPEEESDGPVPLQDEHEEYSRSSKSVASKQNPPGEMNKNFKFPPPGDPVSPVSNSSKDTQATPHQGQQPLPTIKVVDHDLHQGTEQEDITPVGVVAPSSVEVPPPPPVEKERILSAGHDELEDVGETEEISLN
jgi:hypothetical protein